MAHKARIASKIRAIFAPKRTNLVLRAPRPVRSDEGRWEDRAVTDVLQGFGVIGFVIFVGYVVAKWGVLPDSVQEVLGKASFYVFAPALLFAVLSRADWTVLFSQLLPVLFAASLIMMGLGVLIWGVGLRRGVTNTVFLAMGSGYSNANNIGLPVAAYILGDPSLSAPIILFQVVVISPIVLSILDITTGKQEGPRWRVLTRPLRNPMIVASLAGALLSWQNIEVPTLVLEPFSLLGQAAVPVLLFMLGWSMAGQNPLQKSEHRADLVAVTVLKLVVMPVVGWLLATFWLGLEGQSLFNVVVLSALPSAQNLFTYAVRYDRQVAFARDAVMVTTVASAAVFLVIALLLGT